MDLGDDAYGCALFRRGEGGALAGQAGSYDKDVVMGHRGEGSIDSTYLRAT